MVKLPTIGELLQNGDISEDDLQAAISTCVSDPKLTHVVVGKAYRVTLGGTLKTSSFSGRTVRDPEASEGLKRAAVRKALLLARPGQI
ncbi:hypothetical protein AEGHOMDF_1914 [Methylobacterium soli]|nr:hypothetical protein AEGHOMDF_1914 [Methylobacterium soli]